MGFQKSQTQLRDKQQQQKEHITLAGPRKIKLFQSKNSKNQETRKFEIYCMVLRLVLLVGSIL